MRDRTFKVAALVFEFLFVGIFLATMWHLASIEFSLDLIVFGIALLILQFAIFLLWWKHKC